MDLKSLMVSVAVIFTMVSCNREKLFTVRSAKETGLDFENPIVTSDTFNALDFEYIYNGAGVGVGDFNNDGLPDLFFGGNQASSRLYINNGKLKFADVTKQAGVVTDRWVTGVSVIDINQDGLFDVYLSIGGDTTAENRRNLLFVNKGIRDGVPRFEESAHAFGLDSDGYGTMAAFFDYDKDGDPDVYLLNNWLETFNRNNLRPKRVNGEAESTDQLFRNNGDNTFTEVSDEAGILIEGYGLGVSIADINQDSWPDVYVANDFMSNDLLWINQRDGTFKNEIGSYLMHQTHNGMGVDIADFNNDALADIMVVDMLPPGHERQKMMTPGQNYDHFHMSLELGYQPQYMRNTLQLNRGRMPDGRIRFSEIAFLAGVAATDWSWAPLFADLDNDGLKDIFIANGYRKDVTNLDFIFFGMEKNPFGTEEAREKIWREQFGKVTDVKLSNYVFRNNGSLVFQDKTQDWGMNFPGFSNGAAYADLDNDGDLDLITNNIDQEVTLYENNLNKHPENHHYLRFATNDRSSFNQKIWVYAGGMKQFVERTPYRGYQSTVEDRVHFGLGTSAVVDSVIIQWPDSAVLRLKKVPADTVIFFSKASARPVKRSSPEKSDPLFQSLRLAAYKDAPGGESDIKSTRTLLHELSRYGPCVASADVNGDGLEDFFVGAESLTSGQLFIQRPDGTFAGSEADTGDKDGYACFFDADSDGDADLYVGKASSFGLAQPQPHRLYTNDGKGKFSYDAAALPDVVTSASCIEAADFDNDGDLDLFVGGRFKASEYPRSPRSYLLENRSGKFADVTEKLSPSLVEPGMISSAVWADINNDKRIDLILAGEWQPIRIFENNGKTLSEITDDAGLANSNGWWNCIKAADLNKDGLVDFVVGNTGKNSFFRPTVEHPVQIFAKDFDNNGSMDPVITYYNDVEKERFIVHNRLVLIDQIPGIKRRFETFSQYATRPFEKIFSKNELDGSFVGHASKLESVVMINEGGTGFRLMDLPDIAQISTINDILIDDINHDDAADLIIIGNMYAQETLYGRYDASLGTIFLGDNNLHWRELPPDKSGFVVDGDSRFIESVGTRQGQVYVITNNNDSIQFFAPRRHLQPMVTGVK